MGCKESKHIATDNTIIKSTKRGQDDNDKNNVQTFQKSSSGRSPMQKQKSLKENNVGDSKANNVLNENKKSGDDKGAENEKKGGKLKDTNDQVVQGNKELIKENVKVGDETITKEKKDQNGKESILIPKVDLPSISTKDGERIEAINTDGVSGASVYSTPKEVAGAFDNTKTDNAEEERKEPVEETKDTKIEETTPKENLTTTADANLDNYLQEAEVDKKIKEAEAAVANPENRLEEAEVEKKIKDAEEAVEFLEKLVTIKNPVKETDEISSVENPDKEADKSEEFLETQVAATDATHQNPAEQTDKSEEILETETKATDATLQNGVKEIHEVTGKAEDIPVKEVETSHETKQENQASVADKAEEVLDQKAESGKVEDNFVTAAEATSTAMKKLESVAEAQTQEDAASTEEDTKSSSNANEHQISKEDPDAQEKTDAFEKQ
ncbi:uncharacterized protein LOC141683521 isoform X2 [Apium graveolens]|uniref:uncharacterized protein LOC141683521 isoform X2 n=1 Tax=Apium graveolens TaxID=4045 RepID=UPI003D7BC938